MVDAADSKSAAFTGVRVRVSPRAPRFSFIIFNYVVLNRKVKRSKKVIQIYTGYITKKVIYYINISVNGDIKPDYKFH